MIDDELDFENRLMSGTYTPEDNETDFSLRPKTLNDYIGQAKAENGVFNFNGVYPKEIAHGTVVISGPGMADIDPDGDGLYTLATIYKAGDTDLSGAVDVGDVTKILQHLLTPPDYSGVLGSVSDVDGSGAVDVGDLTKLLQYLVGKTANV